MCMKGDACGFLHEMIPERMPECQTFLKKGFCPDPDCVFKHTRENIKECNMYALGFCIFGPECRYNHTRKPGPPPDPSTVEAAKPKMFRDINRVVNAVNSDVAGDAGPTSKRPRYVTLQPLEILHSCARAS
jgi:cleavage and polyadenylation specificity factor subunit 4